MDCWNVVYYIVPSVPERDSNKPTDHEKVARGVFCTLGLIPYHNKDWPETSRGDVSTQTTMLPMYDYVVRRSGAIGCKVSRRRRRRKMSVDGVAVTVSGPLTGCQVDGGGCFWF